MKNNQVMLAQSDTMSSRVNRSNSDDLKTGLRFLRSGHWWEVEGSIAGRSTKYYRCKPVCDVESRFYTSAEIQQSLNESEKRRCAAAQDSDGRGTGRLMTEFNPVHNQQSAKNRFSQPTESLKVLLIGTRETVKKAITSLHAIGYANPADWSPLQVRPNSKEMLSILVVKC